MLGDKQTKLEAEIMKMEQSENKKFKEAHDKHMKDLYEAVLETQNKKREDFTYENFQKEIEEYEK